MRPPVRKKQTLGNKPLTHAKNKCPLSVERASVWPEKNKCPKEKKGAARQPEREKAFWASPESFFPSGQAAHPGSAQEIVRPSVRKNKQAQKNKPLTQQKTNPHLFFQASVGRQTSNQIHVPLFGIKFIGVGGASTG